MSRARPLAASGEASGLVAMVPVFVGVLTGIGVFALAPNVLFRLLGLGIIALVFFLTDMLTTKRVLLAVIIVEIPIQLDVYLQHDPAVAAQQSNSGFNLSVTTICLLGLYGIWAAERLAGPQPSDKGLFRANLPGIVFAAAVVASLVVATDANLVLFEFVIVGQAVLLMIYVAHALRSRIDVLLVIGLVMISILIQFGLAALTHATGSAIQVGIVSTDLVGSRLSGTLGHPNSLGAFLAMVLPLAAAMVLAPVSKKFRWMAAAAFVCGVILIGLAQSRGAFLGLAVGLVVVGTVAYIRELAPRRLILRGLALAAIPLAIQVSLVASRLAAYDNAAATGRLPLVALAFEIIASNPLLGIGANNFAAALDQFLTIDYSATWISTVHNKYLLVWAETGLVGLAAFVWFLVASLRRGVLVARSQERLYAIAGLGLLGGLVAAMIHMVVELYHSRSLVMTLFLVAGLLIALRSLTRSSRRTADDAVVSNYPTSLHRSTN